MRPDSAEEMKRFETGNEQPMKMASNNAFQVTAHKASPNLNADVRKEYMKIRLAADAA